MLTYICCVYFTSFRVVPCYVCYVRVVRHLRSVEFLECIQYVYMYIYILSCYTVMCNENMYIYTVTYNIAGLKNYVSKLIHVINILFGLCF